MSICSTTGKTIYNNLREAYKGLRRMIERVPDYEGEPYYCLYCSFYHFGRKKEKPIKNKRKRT